MRAKTSARWAVIALLLLAAAGGTASVLRTPSAAVGPFAAPAASPDSQPESSRPVDPSVEAPVTENTTNQAATSELAAPAGDGNSVPGPGSSCLTGAEHSPTGELVVVDSPTTSTGEGDTKTYLVEIEEGLGVDSSCFASEVDRILTDDRSWAGDGSMTLERVDSGSVDFRVTLASPATTDLHCKPLETNGIYSCWASDGRAMINVWRWEHGTDEYSEHLDTYREYVINHEVGHALGHGHLQCPAAGELAPVMAQQTKTLDGCRQNGWPLSWER